MGGPACACARPLGGPFEDWYSTDGRGAGQVRIGVPSEIKPDEYRVAITPAGVRELSARGHEVLMQAGAGEGSAMGDEQFPAQGARIVADAQAVFARRSWC